jgi:exopolyphosphatase/guanosine-5'-triphosphate,3'-diphosphate pyrophosphatase
LTRGVNIILAAWWSEATNSDINIIARQLGKKPRNIVAIARRCRWGAPMVVINSPVVWGAGRVSERKSGVSPEMPRVFPTMYWLTCPYLVNHVSRLEGHGEVTRTKEWLEKSGKAKTMLMAHTRAAQERLAIAHTIDHHKLQQEHPTQWNVLVNAGIGGAREKEGIKCLHMHLADYLAGPAGAERMINDNNLSPGTRNPAGARALALLLQQGVDILGCPRCDRSSCSSQGCSAERICALDVGTNSCRMLLSKKQGSNAVRLDAGIQMPRLGAGLSASGHLSTVAINRTLDALRSLLLQAGLADGGANQPAIQAVAVGTQALRSAVNTDEFLLAAWEELRLPVVVVSGAQEARLSFQGVLAGLRQLASPPALDKVAVLDIGGGSTELVLGTSDGQMLHQISVPIGAVYLSEQGTARGMQLNELVQMAKAALAPVYSSVNKKEHSPFTLIGVGGTLTSAVAIHLQLTQYDAQLVTGQRISEKCFWQLATKLQDLRPDERRQQPGLQPERADIIIPGMAIALAVLDTLAADEMVICDSDILQGITEQFMF